MTKNDTSVSAADIAADLRNAENAVKAAKTGMTDAQRRHLDIASARPWMPSVPGDEIDGTVEHLARMERENEYGKIVYPVLTLNTPEGFFAVHCVGTALIRKVMDLRPEIGDHVAFRYLGEQKSGTGRTYKNVVMVNTTAPVATAFSWDDIAAPVTEAEAGF